MSDPSPRIDHVVVLMLENRSFDHMLGFLNHPTLPPVQPGSFPNRLRPSDPTSPSYGVSDDAAYSLPVDPPHSHRSVMKQFGGGRPVRMDGFVDAYLEKASGREVLPIIHWWRIEGLFLFLALAIGLALGFTLGWVWGVVVAGAIAVVGTAAVLWFRSRPRYVRPSDPADALEIAPLIMRCMPNASIPVLGTLAREFAICTAWHCSVPGETWPNRNFAHAATSDGTTDIEIGFYDSPTIFERLQAAGRTWHIYHRGMAQVMAFNELWENGRQNWFDYSMFAAHADANALPAYSFIEPSHQGSASNSQHPGNNLRTQDPCDFERGEVLIAEVYEALRRNPALFERTLLVVTYDEHGGLFDHVPPPTNAVAPTLGKALISASRRFVSFFVTYPHAKFDFRTLGPRVPTVVVSPWVGPGTLDDTLYDHSSIPATLRTMFAPDSKPLTRRDAAAKPFDHLLGARTQPRIQGELPDLSERLAPPPRPVAAPPAAARPGAAPPPPAAPAEPDTFSTQLGMLAERVSERMDQLGVPAAPAPRARMARPGAPPPPPPEPHAEVTDRFAQFCEAGRTEVPAP